jgi:hypothetical protein
MEDKKPCFGHCLELCRNCDDYVTCLNQDRKRGVRENIETEIGGEIDLQECLGRRNPKAVRKGMAGFSFRKAREAATGNF